MHSPASAWNHSAQRAVARRLQACYAVMDMLRLARKRVVIIDSYAWNERAIAFISKLISDIFCSRASAELPEINIIFKASKASATSAHVRAAIMNALSQETKDIILKVLQLEQIEGNDVFHNRYILTEHGGVLFGHGIALPEDDNHFDDISLMDKDVYNIRWSQFLRSSCYSVVDEA